MAFVRDKNSIYLSFRKGFFFLDGMRCRSKALFDKRRPEPLKAKRVVFVIDHSSPRVYKIIKQLNKNGWEIIAFYRYKRGKDIEREIGSYVKIIKKYVSAYAAYALCRQYEGSLFHVFCCYTYDVPELLIRKKVGKVVLDNYDGFAGFIAGWNRTRSGLKTAASERYCLENADGLTCRSFESQYNKHEMGYRFKRRRLLFLDYCSIEKEYYLREHKLNEEPVFFYGGGVPDEVRYPDFPFSCLTETARILDKKGCCFWVYHSRVNPSLQQHYQSEFDSIKRAVFHDAIPFDDMINLMQNCDFSIMPAKGEYYFSGKNEDSDGIYHYAKYIYATANKFFDAIEVGIPIIGYAPSRIVRVLSRCGVIRCSMDELESKLDDIIAHYSDYRAEIRKNIDKFSIERHIHRLIDYYIEIVAED